MQEEQKLIDQHYLANFNGPVLFTSPHSKTLKRGGENFDIPEEIHKRQKFAGWIAMRLATDTKVKNENGKMFQSASFMIWGTSKNQTDPDPNYLKQEMFQECVFHHGIHAWARQNQGQPLFHVDVHGKNNSNDQCVIDVGTKATKRAFGDKDLIDKLNYYFHEKLQNKFSNWSFREKKCVFNSKNPHFKGSWGNGIYTMADQSARIGIPSIQLEIPIEVREKLFQDPQLLTALHRSLFKVYRKVIVPYWQKLGAPKINEQSAKLCKQTVKTQDFEKCIQQEKQMEERKAEKYKNEKKQ